MNKKKWFLLTLVVFIYLLTVILNYKTDNWREYILSFFVYILSYYHILSAYIFSEDIVLQGHDLEKGRYGCLRFIFAVATVLLMIHCLIQVSG